MLPEYSRVLSSEKFAILQKLIIIIINLECCRAYRCCSAFSECLYLVYYACHVKLNILGRIVIPDKVALGSSAIFCYRNHTEKV